MTARGVGPRDRLHRKIDGAVAAGGDNGIDPVGHGLAGHGQRLVRRSRHQRARRSPAVQRGPQLGADLPPLPLPGKG